MNYQEKRTIAIIEQIRQFKQWSTKEFAAKINYTPGAWRNIVKGRRGLNFSLLEKIAEVFNCEIINLF